MATQRVGGHRWAWIAALAMLAAAPLRSEPLEPDQVRPATSTMADLRAVVSVVSNSVGESLDQGHDWLYRKFQYALDDLDTRFASEDAQTVIVPLSPMRIGFDAEFLHRQEGIVGLAGHDFEAAIHVPNLERRLRLFITSNDLQEGPRDRAQARTPVRAGVRFAPFEHFDFEVGVRAKVWPSAFAAATWSSPFTAGRLRVYPFAKAYVESGLGAGVSSGLALERWRGRWVVRSAGYANWVRNTAAIDWTQTFIAGYARGVIQQRRYDRLADGHDLACGILARIAISGDRVSRTAVYETSVLVKRPLRGRWLYVYAGPMVRWERQFTWHPDLGVVLGFDALFWGLSSRPTDVAGYCE
jgi:hypothetical protein